MIRFYYILFANDDESWHNGFTPNKLHFSLFLKDRVRLIHTSLMNGDKVHIGHLDAEHSGAFMSEIVNRQFPDCRLDTNNYIDYYTVNYVDKPLCVTDAEVDMISEYDGYGGWCHFNSYDGYCDMSIFEAIHSLSLVLKIFFNKELTIHDTVNDVYNRIAWYMIIMLNLYDHSSCTREFSDKFKRFLYDIFPNRKDVTDFLIKEDLIYGQIHDVVFDYHRAIVGEPLTLSIKDMEEERMLHERFLTLLDADD